MNNESPTQAAATPETATISPTDAALALTDAATATATATAMPQATPVAPTDAVTATSDSGSRKRPGNNDETPTKVKKRMTPKDWSAKYPDLPFENRHDYLVDASDQQMLDDEQVETDNVPIKQEPHDQEPRDYLAEPDLEEDDETDSNCETEVRKTKTSASNQKTYVESNTAARETRLRRDLINRIEQNCWVLDPTDERLDAAKVKKLQDNKDSEDKHQKSPNGVRAYLPKAPIPDNSPCQPLVDIAALMARHAKNTRMVDYWFTAKEKHGTHHLVELSREFHAKMKSKAPVYTTDLDQARSDLDQARTDLDQARTDLDQARTEHDNLTGAYNRELQRVIDDANGRIQRRIDTIRQVNADRAAEKKDLEGKVKNLQGNVAQLTSELAKARNALAVAEADLARLPVREALKQEKRRIEQQRLKTQMEEKKMEAEKMIAATQKMIADMQKEYDERMAAL